jgi:hypothetical protein
VGELLDRAAGRGGAVEVGRAHGPLGRALPSPYTILSGRFGAKLRPWIHPYAIVFTIAPFPQTLFAPIPVGVSDPQGWCHEDRYRLPPPARRYGLDACAAPTSPPDQNASASVAVVFMKCCTKSGQEKPLSPALHPVQSAVPHPARPPHFPARRKDPGGADSLHTSPVLQTARSSCRHSGHLNLATWGAAATLLPGRAGAAGSLSPRSAKEPHPARPWCVAGSGGQGSRAWLLAP